MILSGSGDQASNFVYHHVRLVLGVCSGIGDRLETGEKESEPLTATTRLNRKSHGRGTIEESEENARSEGKIRLNE